MLPELEPLRGVGLLRGLGAAHLRAVAAVAAERHAAAGETILRAGDRADGLLVIRRGRVELSFPLLVLGEAREVRFQALEAGGTLGWSALLAPSPLTMSARATTEVDLLVLPGERLRAVLEAQPAIGHVVMSNLADEVAAGVHEIQALWVRELQRNLPPAA